MVNTATDYVHGLPIRCEKTSFRLNQHEIDILYNNEFYQPDIKHIHLSKTSFLLKDKRLNRIKQFFDERMNNYIKNVVEVRNKFVMTQSWSTITKKGEHHHTHNHPNTMFSLVFYVSSEGERSGNFMLNFGLTRLEERWLFKYDITNYNTFNSGTWEYEVHSGDVIIFPAWVLHSTRENTTDKDRIIVGANYFIDGEVGSTEGVDKINIQLGDVHD
tara:strand:- start:77 stop:724 length:648 start_codon:yes stop_codon:yes gene_type:complete